MVGAVVFHAGDCSAGKILTAVGPFVRTAVLEKYGENTEKRQICPGEKNCEKFQSARGDTHAAKEVNACRPCELFPTKRERFRRSQVGLQELVDFAEYAQRRRDSGYPLSIDQMSNLMLETMLMMDEYQSFQERKISVEIRQALVVGFGLKVN